MYSASRGWKRGVGRTESPDQEMLDSGLYRTTPAWVVPGGRTGRTTRVFSAASADVGKRSAGQDFFNSWVSVAVAECITIPIDTVKVRLMLQGELGAKKQYNGGVHAFRTILKNEGPQGLFKGLAPAVLRQSIYGTFRYGSYDQIKNELGATGGNIPIWKKVLASCFAGGMGSFLAVPCDLVKIRMQADAAGTRYKSTMSAFAEVAKKEGVKGMWRGAGPTVSRAAVGAMTELPVYDEVKSAAINAGIVQPGIQSHLFSALCAGFFSTFWMNPFDVAKSRIMNQHITASGSPTYTGLMDCFGKTIKSEGVASLWKGFWPAYTRIGPRVIIIFVVLEQMREINS